MTFAKWKLKTLVYISIVLLAESCDLERRPEYGINEDIPIGSAVEYGVGDTTSVGNITLDSSLSEYFEIDTSWVLTTKKDITRDKLQIEGKISCISSTGATSEYDRTFTIQLYNNKSEIVTNDACSFDFKENFLPEVTDATYDLKCNAQDDDDPDYTYEIVRQSPSDYFVMRNTDKSDIRLSKPLDYESVQQVVIEFLVTTTGKAANLNQTATFTVTVNVTDVDDNDPTFAGCSSIVIDGISICSPPAFKAYVPPKSSVGTIVAADPPILVQDMDAVANKDSPVALYLRNADGDPTTEFSIDSDGNLALQVADVSFGERYQYFVIAVQDGSKVITAPIDITIIQEDTQKPVVVPSKTIGYLEDSNPNPGALVRVVDNSGAAISITSSDGDDSDATFAYECSPDSYQVINGQLYYIASTTRASLSDAQITSINLNAEVTSSFRTSDALTVSVSDTTPEGVKVSGTGSDQTLIIVASVLSVVIFLLLCIILYLVCKQKGKKKKVDSIADHDDDEKLVLAKRSSSNATDYTNSAFEKESIKQNHEYETALRKISNPSSVHEENDETNDSDDNISERSESEDPPHVYSLNIGDTEQGESTSEKFEDQDANDHQENEEEVRSSMEVEDETQPEEEESYNFDEEPDVPDPIPTPPPPPPMVMFAPPPVARAPSLRRDGPAAVVNEIEGHIMNLQQACQRNLCEHLRYLKEGQNSSTELVSLKRFGIDRKDTFAVVKNYKKSAMFEHEIETIKSLDELMAKVGSVNNDYVLQYYGQYESEDYLRHSVQFVTNKSLNKFFHKNQRSGNSRLRINLISGITKGLSFIHSNNVVHGKLTSHCIWIDENLIPKVHGYENNCGLHMAENDEKRRWLAPEILEGEQNTYASDIWSLGVVMWEIISGGEVPYDGVNVSDLFAYLQSDQRLKQPDMCRRDMFALVADGCWEFKPNLRLDVKIMLSNIDEKFLEDPEDLIGKDLDPKVDFSENHKVRFEDVENEDLTEF